MRRAKKRVWRDGEIWLTIRHRGFPLASRDNRDKSKLFSRPIRASRFQNLCLAARFRLRFASLLKFVGGFERARAVEYRLNLVVFKRQRGLQHFGGVRIIVNN